MLSVRKNLTEILLEVTNEMIEDVANETLSKMRSKGQKFIYPFDYLLCFIFFCNDKTINRNEH